MADRILAPQPGIEPVSRAVEVHILTTGMPGKSPESIFICVHGRILLHD